MAVGLFDRTKISRFNASKTWMAGTSPAIHVFFIPTWTIAFPQIVVIARVFLRVDRQKLL